MQMRSTSAVTFACMMLLPLAAIYYLFFQQFTQYSHTVPFQGDTSEYQAMGVNMAYGHPLNSWGELEPFHTYAFSPESEKENPQAFKALRTLFIDAAATGGRMTVTRTPLYPLFLAGIYRVIGIDPYNVRHIQLFMLALVGAALPLLGALWWKERGLISGLIAGVPFMATTMRFAEHIMVETLLIFLLCTLCTSIAFYEKRPYILRAILVGLLCGLCLLTKATVILLLPILIVLLFFHSPQRYRLRELVIMLCACAAIITPWSIIASGYAHEMVILSAQTSGTRLLLLDAHNELTATDGMWHPEWRTDAGSFYGQNGGTTASSALQQVIRFYTAYPHLIIPNVLSKLAASVLPISALTLMVLLCMGEGLLGRRLDFKPARRAWLAVLLFSWLLFIIPAHTRMPVLWAINMRTIPTLVCLLVMFVLLYMRAHRSPAILRIPSVGIALILNYLIVMSVVMSDDAMYASRYVKTGDFLFILIAIHLVSLWVIPLKEKQLESGISAPAAASH